MHARDRQQHRGRLGDIGRRQQRAPRASQTSSIASPVISRGTNTPRCTPASTRAAGIAAEWRLARPSLLPPAREMALDHRGRGASGRRRSAPITKIEANTPPVSKFCEAPMMSWPRPVERQEKLRRDHADQRAADRLAHAGHGVGQGVGQHHLAPQRPFARAERVRDLDHFRLDAARAFDGVVEHRETPRTGTPPAPSARSRSPSSTG